MRRIALIVALAACSEETPNTLRWSFGENGVGCAQAGVTTVHVHIGPLAPAGSYDHEVSCPSGEGEGVALIGISPGRHTIVLKALASDRVLFLLKQEIDVPAGGDLGTLILPPYTPP
jgi:hypothetical protein